MASSSDECSKCCENRPSVIVSKKITEEEENGEECMTYHPAPTDIKTQTELLEADEHQNVSHCKAAPLQLSGVMGDCVGDILNACKVIEETELGPNNGTMMGNECVESSLATGRRNPMAELATGDTATCMDVCVENIHATGKRKSVSQRVTNYLKLLELECAASKPTHSNVKKVFRKDNNKMLKVEGGNRKVRSRTAFERNAIRFSELTNSIVSEAYKSMEDLKTCDLNLETKSMTYSKTVEDIGTTNENKTALELRDLKHVENKTNSNTFKECIMNTVTDKDKTETYDLMSKSDTNILKPDKHINDFAMSEKNEANGNDVSYDPELPANCNSKTGVPPIYDAIMKTPCENKSPSPCSEDGSSVPITLNSSSESLSYLTDSDNQNDASCEDECLSRIERQFLKDLSQFSRKNIILGVLDFALTFTAQNPYMQHFQMERLKTMIDVRSKRIPVKEIIIHGESVCNVLLKWGSLHQQNMPEIKSDKKESVPGLVTNKLLSCELELKDVNDSEPVLFVANENANAVPSDKMGKDESTICINVINEEEDLGTGDHVNTSSTSINNKQQQSFTSNDVDVDNQSCMETKSIDLAENTEGNDSEIEVTKMAVSMMSVDKDKDDVELSLCSGEHSEKKLEDKTCDIGNEQTNNSEDHSNDLFNYLHKNEIKNEDKETLIGNISQTTDNMRLWNMLNDLECPFTWKPREAIKMFPSVRSEENIIDYLTGKDKTFTRAKKNLLRETVINLVVVYEKAHRNQISNATRDLQHCYEILTADMSSESLALLERGTENSSVLIEGEDINLQGEGSLASDKLPEALSTPESDGFNEDDREKINEEPCDIVGENFQNSSSNPTIIPQDTNSMSPLASAVEVDVVQDGVANDQNVPQESSNKCVVTANVGINDLKGSGSKMEENIQNGSSNATIMPHETNSVPPLVNDLQVGGSQNGSANAQILPQVSSTKPAATHDVVVDDLKGSGSKSKVEIQLNSDKEKTKYVGRLIALHYIIKASLAHLAFYSGQWDDAAMLAEELHNKYEEFSAVSKATVLAVRALILCEYSNVGNKLSLPFLRQALALDPDYWEWNLYLGKVMGRVRRVERNSNGDPTQEEIQLLEKAVSLHRQDAACLVYLANVYRTVSSIQYRREQLNETATSSSEPYIHSRLQGNWRNNRAPRHQGHWGSKEPSRLLASRPPRSSQRDLLKLASELYRDALALEPHCPYINTRCAKGLWSMPYPYRDNNLAQDAIVHAQTLAQDDSLVNHYAGMFYEHRRDFEKALECYERATQDKSNYPAEMSLINLRLKLAPPGSYSPIFHLDALMNKYTSPSHVVQTLCMRAFYLYKVERQLLQAINNFCKAIKVDPTNPSLQSFYPGLFYGRSPYSYNIYDVLESALGEFRLRREYQDNKQIVSEAWEIVNSGRKKLKENNEIINRISE